MPSVARTCALVAIGILLACTREEDTRPIEARAFRALLIGAASATATDTICLSVATATGETDPAPDILQVVQRKFPGVVPSSACGSVSPEPPTVRLISARLPTDSAVEAVGETIAEHTRRHRCTMANGAKVPECAYIPPNWRK